MNARVKTATWVVSMISLLAVMPASAASVYGTAATMNGSTQLSSFNGWTNVSLGWNISFSNLMYHYQYTFNYTGSNLSHLVLETSSNCTGDPQCLTNGNHNPQGPQTWAAQTAPNFEMPASIFGYKFSPFDCSGTCTFSFDSNRAPVWHDVFARDGGNGYAFDPGLLDHSSSDPTKFVASPDSTGSSVPEPSTYAMFAFGLAVLALRRANKYKS